MSKIKQVCFALGYNRLRLGKIEVNFIFLSACTVFLSACTIFAKIP